MTDPKFKTLPHGQMVLADDSHISRWAEEHGGIITSPELSKQLLGPLLRRIKPSCIWDIGAFIGDHTLYYLSKAPTVVAFEPNPDAFACLVHNCPAAVAVNMAVSDTNTVLRFSRAPNAGASRILPDGEVPIETCVPDGMDLPVPQFVKIDAEGWEMHVLRGMERIIREHKPAVFIEINRGALVANGADWPDIRNFFLTRGYNSAILCPTTANWEDPQYDVLFLP